MSVALAPGGVVASVGAAGAVLDGVLAVGVAVGAAGAVIVGGI